MRYHFYRFLTLLLALLLAATPCLAESMHREIQHPDLILEVTVGYDGLMTYGRTMPIHVRVENSGADLDGTVAVNIYASKTLYNRYEYDLTLAQGAAKEFVIPVNVTSKQDMFTVEILEGGQKLCAVSAEPKQIINPSSMLIGALSAEPKNLSYMGITMETDELLRSEYSQVVPLSAETFPDSAELLSSFGMLVIDGFDADTLSSEQQAALQEWLESGRILILGGGAQAGVTWPHFSNMTGLLPGQVVQGPDATPALLEYLELTSAPLGQEMLLASASGGEAFISDGETPLIWRTAVGSGVIYTTAFELGAKPISTWPLMHTFWQRLLLKDNHDLYELGFYTRNSSYSNLPYLTTRIPMENDFGIGAVVLTAAAFLLVSGVGLYLLLRRLDKRQYLWIALPAMTVACTCIVCALAAGSESNQPTLLYVSSLYQEEDGTLSCESVASVALPAKGEHIVTTSDGTLKPNDNSYYYSAYGYSDGEEPAEPTELNIRYIKGAVSGAGLRFTTPWETKSFTIPDVAAPEGAIDTALWREENGFRGYIVNNTSLSLSEGALICRYGYCSIPALAPGERHDLTLVSATFADPQNPVYEDGCMYESLSGGYYSPYTIVDEYFYKSSQLKQGEERNITDETSLMVDLMLSVVDPPYQSNSAAYATIFHYAAFTDDLPAPALMLDGRSIGRQFGRGVVGAVMNFNSVSDSGLVYRTPGMDSAVRCQIDSDGSPYFNAAAQVSTAEYHRLSESPAFMFDLTGTGNVDVGRMIVYCESYYRNTHMYLYNGTEWVEHTIGTEIADPNSYLTDGRLYVQFRADGAADEYIELSTPTMLLEGRVK